MALYDSRPSTIEAVHWTGDNFEEVAFFTEGKVEPPTDDDELQLNAGVDGASGWVDVPVGHWIARKVGDTSDYWPVEANHMAAKYRPHESGPSRVEQLEAALSLMVDAFGPGASKIEPIRDVARASALSLACELLARDLART